ncbi:hypothetical protein [Prosthecochloris sp. SCSIO W1103]|uniref:hypothetical protein n=1 Tax=Prosthecochloris sp. SCSIO W1103 TaxID=2992244 RepID=UPI00223E6B0F|nr:hypothetical protein [Prosthecochloris sp. SCSIO W1103]UZJ37863.1 hypothetical protein OO005_01290 [Prosthecochloris sp. SCSIO W1103]
MDEMNLLGMQRAEFQHAKIVNRRSKWMQIFIVVISIASVFMTDRLFVYTLVLINLVLALLWLYFSTQAKKSHNIAERARRALVLFKGLGIALGRKSFADLKMSVKSSEDEWEKYKDANYFKAEGQYGYKMLTEMLEESCFWSKHLFKKCATRYWYYFIAVLALSVIGLLAVPLLNPAGSGLLISQAFCLVLIWLISGNLFADAYNFSSTASLLDSIEERLSSMVDKEEDNQDVLSVFCDYNALVGGAPTIPLGLYEKYRDKLNKLWDEQKQGLV